MKYRNRIAVVGFVHAMDHNPVVKEMNTTPLRNHG